MRQRIKDNRFPIALLAIGAVALVVAAICGDGCAWRYYKITTVNDGYMIGIPP